VAHLLVDQLRLPVLGRDEDAAENFATYVLLLRGSAAADQAIADAAFGCPLSGVAIGNDFEKSDFYNEHSLEQQRAYQIVCLMVGKDAATFSLFADDYGMDRDRQEKCSREYGKLERSIHTTVGRYLKVDAKGTEVNITYHSVSGKLKLVADAFRRSGVFENVAEEVRANYALSYPVSFRAKHCGEPNAFYDAARVEIVYCCEFMDDMLKLIANDMPKGIGQQQGNGLGRVLSGPGLGSTQ
jgi:hypothetical protein